MKEDWKEKGEGLHWGGRRRKNSEEGRGKRDKIRVSWLIPAILLSGVVFEQGERGAH